MSLMDTLTGLGLSWRLLSTFFLAQPRAVGNKVCASIYCWEFLKTCYEARLNWDSSMSNKTMFFLTCTECFPLNISVSLLLIDFLSNLYFGPWDVLQFSNWHYVAKCTIPGFFSYSEWFWRAWWVRPIMPLTVAIVFFFSIWIRHILGTQFYQAYVKNPSWPPVIEGSLSIS